MVVGLSGGTTWGGCGGPWPPQKKKITIGKYENTPAIFNILQMYFPL
jgi:hypothetical protein